MSSTDLATPGGRPSLDELRSLIARLAARPGAVEGVMVSSVEEPGPPSSTVAEPVLAVVAQGAKRLTLGDRVHDYGAGQYLVVSVGLPVTGHYTRATRERPFLGFGLTLRPAAVASLLLEAGAAAPGDDGGPPGGGRGGGRATAPPGIVVGDASDDLLDAVVRMVRLLARPADVPVLAPMIEREILWRLLTGPKGGLVRQIGLADSRLSHIGRAIRALRDRFAEPVRVEELARMSGMSASAFHRHFRAVTAMTPIQYQKDIRLQEARLLLLAGPRDVASAGYAVGYDSASQFNREYRRRFGVPPGRDAVRLRERAQGAAAGGGPL
ncbi:AraC family transcriptional regulator [Streptomyces fuscigenes]|uniref:AraC family transcriptional regulator n=1 Tax=Streptomyces fuscigenes TaxID=1528880 RepID=UPI001F1C8DE6|nr:AraC family transcriptional regulator [Streptomyces fuscigenes]MCF3961868.1 AraC family transcriptional regulator [Streptomyces fuscigenes]